MKKYKEPQSLTDVAVFHDMFDLPILEIPQIPNAKRCELRIALLQEEFDELKDAIANNDLVEAADAFCDIQYVLAGAILEFGMGDKFKALFDEVQRSNMSKTCRTLNEAKQTQAYYLETRNTESTIQEKNGEYLVFRKSDSKVLKSINYSPADIEKILTD